MVLILFLESSRNGVVLGRPPSISLIPRMMRSGQPIIMMIFRINTRGVKTTKYFLIKTTRYFLIKTTWYFLIKTTTQLSPISLRSLSSRSISSTSEKHLNGTPDVISSDSILHSSVTLGLITFVWALCKRYPRFSIPKLVEFS